MYKSHRIAVVMPCYNEAGKIGRGIKKVPMDIVDEVIIVDDGSTDGTAKEAKEAGATVIRHEVNQGVGAGIRAGFSYALQRGYDVISLMAGDDQDVPTEINRLLDKIIDEGYDYVHGSRWLKDGVRIKHPYHRSVFTRLYSVIFHILFGFHTTDATNGFRAFKAKILLDPAIRLDQEWLDKYELEPYFLVQVVRNKYKIAEVPVTKVYHEKQVGNTKMIPFKSWWSIFRPLVLLKLGLRS